MSYENSLQTLRCFVWKNKKETNNEYAFFFALIFGMIIIGSVEQLSTSNEELRLTHPAQRRGVEIFSTYSAICIVKLFKVVVNLLQLSELRGKALFNSESFSTYLILF